MEYVNETEGLGRVLNNTKLYIRLLTKFKDANNLNDIFEALQAEDYVKAQSAIHTIKGIAANLSLTALYEQSKSLEIEIKAHAVQEDSLEKIKVCFAETIGAINKVLSRYV
ncbi:MAG: Hpt domain-containing protein [Spirochaetaceae bacterium]|jgi:HPt (histidine-containing phosphotransfer) domain-containing protein|nr:Hpt domain-containing protein [Spirochaetaceae bacterium]